MNSRSPDEEYLTDGNKAVEFKLIRTVDDLLDDSGVFKPDMCHQIFGDKELIYGYKDLRIKIYYSAAWQKIYCGTEFSEKLEDVEPSDLLRKISNKYEMPLIENVEVFQQQLDEERKFVPFGELISTFVYVEDGKNETFTYELYLCTNETPGFRDYHKSLQTFLLWYIDAASFLDFDDSSWKFFVVYEKYKTNHGTGYAFVGIVTIYEYYGYPDLKRPRISQVLVLPPFQGRGICAKLLTSIYDFYSTKTNILDFTVEDPCEVFQRVRDFVDCTRLLNSSSYDANMLCKERRKEFISLLHTNFKINKRQARRVYEILRLKNLCVHDKDKFAEFRLEVKGRLNQPFQKQNKVLQRCGRFMSEQEMQENFISDEDRKAKLETMFSELLQDYMSVINRIEKGRPTLQCLSQLSDV